jgi:predicted N-acyltransferase
MIVDAPDRSLQHLICGAPRRRRVQHHPEAHKLAHPLCADAMERFLERETGAIDDYLDVLIERNAVRPRAAG